ncbi:Na/Pi cotransporter family protein [Corynebacterium hylobatis]|uniref:Na/Pi cotransporter family protein n=1 Tax=Corynebacterium hylobatis TaxID=1859290 RepID=A0A430I0L4_9CORY|nr:Na/Pi cotransporter family protein [Corynebacterium hylobatis]RSZ65152.1 Na/Pi cotransporter family protein [Corynebacterium hylobatis]
MTAGRTRPVPLPGTQHFINPRKIPAERDFVALSTFGATVRWMGVAGAVLMMITAIYLILDGAQGLGTGTVARLFELATNPFIGLLIGILATAAIQSSTTVTTLTVAAVGTGAVSVPVAIPIILGANVGTTVTASLVAFSYVGDRANFRRAFTSASLHTWFNLTFVCLIFPLELLFQPLQRFTNLVADSLLAEGTTGTSRGLFTLFSPLIGAIGTDGLLGSLLSPHIAAMAGIVLGVVLVLTAVRILNAQLSVLTAAATRTLLERSSGASDALGVFSGTVGTAAVQASSITVSSLLPFAVSKSLKLREILALTLGANVGTTLMALITALAVPGSLGPYAVQAGLVHVTFNTTGTLLVLLIRPLREWLIRLAELSGRLAARGYSYAATAMLLGYFLIPAVVILIYTLLS